MKKINKLTILTSMICMIPVVVGIALYSKLPDQMATHWNASGVPDGYSSKLVGAILFPCIFLVLNMLVPVLLKMDPKYENMSDKLVKLVYWIMPILSLFCCSTIISSAFGKNIRMELIVPAMIGVLFVIIGNYLPKTKQSYTMGIKLPWTLNSEENWNATHRLAGYLWVVGGFLMIISSFFSFRAVLIVIVVILMVGIPVVYSYMFYLKEKTKK